MPTREFKFSGTRFHLFKTYFTHLLKFARNNPLFGSVSFNIWTLEQRGTAILRVLSNLAVLALLKIMWPLFIARSNNEVLRNLTIPVI
jgi:hypothetical protein